VSEEDAQGFLDFYLHKLINYLVYEKTIENLLKLVDVKKVGASNKDGLYLLVANSVFI
jgi:hypothetical protein